MPEVRLTNFTIRKLQDKRLQDYLLIINEDNPEEVYFGFRRMFKNPRDWDCLAENQLSEIEFEYEEGESPASGKVYKRVTNLLSNSEVGSIFV